MQATVLALAALLTGPVASIDVPGAAGTALEVDPVAQVLYVGGREAPVAIGLQTLKPVDPGQGPDGGLAFQGAAEGGEVEVLDPRWQQPLSRFKLGPGLRPTGLAFDLGHHRLFVACADRALVVVDVVTGQRVASLPVKAAAVAFDPGLHHLYAAGSAGDLAVVDQLDHDHYALLGTLHPFERAGGVAVDLYTHRVYLEHGGKVAVFEP